MFPQAAACFETIVGDIQIPDHPLCNEVMKDVLTEAMDIEGLNEILRGIASGAIRCLAVDTPVPSQFAHELVNAMPYAFLDEADANERRARATTLRRGLPATAEDAGRLDPAAIATVRRELHPDLRDEHELHDLLQSLILLPLAYLDQPKQGSALPATGPTFIPSSVKQAAPKPSPSTTSPAGSLLNASPTRPLWNDFPPKHKILSS